MERLRCSKFVLFDFVKKRFIRRKILREYPHVRATLYLILYNMAEWQRFSERKSRLQDFKAWLQWDQGAGTQQTQQTQQDTSGQQATGGVFLPWINTDYSSTLPKTWYQWALESGKIQSNVVLPWINDKATTISHIDPNEAIEWMKRFQDEENDRITSQYLPLVRRWLLQLKWWYQKRANANLSKEWILEKLARIWQVNWASKSAMQEYIDENEKQTLEYNKKVNDAFKQWENKNMDMKLLENYEWETISWLLSRWDGRWATYKLIKWLSENINMIPEMVVTIVAPEVWLPLMAWDVYIQESQWAFEEMMDNWATYNQAINWATIVWVANASIELLLERFLWWVQRAWATTFRRLFTKNLQKEVVRNITKKGVSEIFWRWLLWQIKSSAVEWLEEILQQRISNAFVKTVNSDKKLSEWLVESFDQAFWQSFFFPLWWWSESVISDLQSNREVEKNADLEALDYVLQWEQRKAQRMQQAKQRMKDRFLGKDTTEEFTQEDQEQFEREWVEEQQQSEELRTENNRETTIQNEMEREVLSEWDLNEDLWDPRFQKTEATDINEINKDLKDIKDSLEKMDDNTFFNRIMASINKWGKRNFVVFNKNGQKSVLRVMETKSKWKWSKGKTVTVQVMQPSKKSGNVIMSQFTYNPWNLSIEQKQWIITWFENWGKTGKFTDNTSNNEKYQLKYEEKDYNPWVANKNEKNISGKEWVKQRNKVNDETIEQLAKKYWVKVEVIKWLVKVLKNWKWTWWYAYGKYLDQVLTLSEQIKESTAPHELLHAIFDMIDPETKAYLISQVMKSEGWSAKKAEEWLADSFSNFFRTGKIEWAPKSTWGKIKIFFKRVRSFINGLGRWRSELEEIFSDIITSEGIEELQWRIDQNQRLQEAKARMRERFMEYAKNAEKMQKKAESKTKSQEKYQNTWKNEENGYTNSWQRSSSGSAWKISTLNAPFSFNTKTIQYNWRDITHVFDPKDSFLTNYTFSVPQELQQYVDLFNRAIENWYESAIIWELDWRYIKIYFNRNFADHFEKHGGFAPENLIMTLNRFDAFAQRIVDWKKKLIFEKQLPNGNYLVAITSTNLTEISFYESDNSKVWYGDVRFQLAWDIESEAFKKRFGDSKIVNKNGTPKIMYHGTPYGWFTIFKWYNRWSIWDDGYFGRWFYFTDDKALARDYSDEAFIDPEERTTEPWEYGNVEIKEVYLKVENPYIIEQKDVEYDKWALEKLLGTKDPSESTKKLQDEWYDGVIYRFDDGVEEVTVFEPNQIKSATDNVGTYDPNNDDIRYQTVYHWSRAEFDKFDSSHMWEWEWDQVHGRWHYVAVDPKTAKRYAELWAVLYKWKQIWWYDNILSEIWDLPTDKKNFLKDIAYDVAKKGKTVQEAKDDLINKYKWFIKDLEESVKDNEKNLEKLEKSGKTSRIDYNQLIKNWKDYIKRDKELLKIIENIDVNDFSKRNFYEVEIPDPVKADTPTWSNYFEEKKILNKEEINRIMDALLKKKTKWSERVQKAIDYDLKDWEDISGRSMVFNLRAGLWDKQASKFLESLWYDGIHYYWLRDGEAYVIFNDDLEITNHEKYQEADDIDPEARDPYKMISQTWKAGNMTNVAYVFDKFISEKAKDKALHSVPKEWLNEWKAPALMHTNKYVDKPFYKFDNVKDSRYKRVKDGIVVSFFTDNFYMSQSYARGIPTVAKTKKRTITDDELKNELKRMSEDNSSKWNESLFGGLYSDKETKFSTQKNKDGTVSLVSKQKFYQHYDYERFIRDYTTQINLEKMWITYSEVFKDPDNVIDFLIENVNKTFDGKDAYVKASREDNGVLVEIYDKSIKWTYPSMEELKDNVVRYEDKEDMYSYIWYGQNINKLLLLDQFKWEYWNQMGRLDDVFNLKNIHYEKEVWRFIDSVYKAMDGLSYRMEAFKERYNDSEFNRNTYDESGKMREEVRIIWDLIGSVDEWVISMMDNLRDLLEWKDTTEAQQNVLNSYTTWDLTTRWETVRDALEELYDFLDHNYNELRRLDWNGIKDWIYSIWWSEWDIAVLEHHYNTNWSLMKDIWRTWKEDMARDLNPKFNMETNDWVRYAIAEGYDAIKMEEIYDYGGNVDYELPWNIYVTLRNNEFKAWDNADPTDSSDIRYQTVYHGSRADFENFDSTHMWEWEWNQAHGRWHYVAVDPATARHYAEITWKWDYTWGYDGKTYNDLIREYISWGRERWEIALLTDLIQDMWNTFGQYTMQEIIDKRIERAEKALKNDEAILREEKNLGTPWYATVEDIQWWIAKDKKTLEALKSIDVNKFYEAEPSRKRNFYEVEIPDDNGRNYIEEWEKVGVRNQKRIADQLKKEWWEIHESYGHLYADSYPDGKLVEMILPDPDQTWENWIWYDAENPKEISQLLNRAGWVGIHYYWGRDGEAYVIFDDNDLDIRNHEKYQEIEYEYDENGNRKWLKFWDNSERDPSIFGEVSRKDQIEEDKENEKSNPFYNAWVRYNNQNYEDDQLTFDEFIQGISERADNAQREYDQKIRDLSESQNDPQLLDLQLRAVKLMEEEGKVGKKFWKNVSKEVRDRQQAEVEKKREQLIQDIVDYMYPWLKTEEITYDMQKEADQKEAEWEMLWKEWIEEKLKYFKKDKNGNWEAKTIKIENPQEKLDKLLSAGKFDEIFTPLDRVLEWKTPQGQKGILDNQKDPKKYKSVLEKINKGTTKTKVTLKDVTRDYRALEKYRAEQEAEKERRKKERQEEFAKKKQEEYKKLVRMSAFQRLIDMQRLEKYPFLSENDIKERYGFTDEEWKKITEQEEIKLPKKWGDKARSDFNKAVDSYVRDLIKWLDWQNKMKQREAEKNLWEIWEIDVDVLLWRDEEKGQKEVEEFEKLAKEKREEKKLKIEDVKIDEEREQNKEEKAKVDKLIKSTKSDKTVRWSIKEFTSNILTPVSTKIREISPKIHREVMRYFQNKDIITNERLKEAEPFLQAMRKIRKENPVRFMDIWVNLANRNIWYANGLLKEYWVTVPTELLDKIYLESQDVWLNINYLWSYYPLSVKAPRSFLEELMKVNKKDIASEIEKKIMAESQKKWWPLEEAEITAIINEVIAWEENKPDVNVGNAHLKKRNTEIKRTAKMLEYCDDPISTLIGYIEWMTQSIERAKFLWKSRSWNVHTLADYVYNAKNGLTPDQQDELMDLLKAVFNDANPSKAIQTWRDIATLTTLWSPSSTLTQLWDLSFSVYENGWRETLKAVWDVWMGRKAFDLIDMWVLNRWEEYANINSRRNLLQKAIHNVFKLTFFSKFDTFWKSAFIQSTWNKWTRMARKWDKQLRKDIMKWTDDEYMTDKIIKDLSENNFSQEVALIMYMKLSNIQPLTRAQMPKAYLNNPNWRLFYQFKTFGIKQLDYVLQETREQTKNFKNLSTGEKLLRIVQIANMVFVMTLLGVGADELKDITMRRRNNSLILRWLFGDGVGTEQIWEKMEDNVLKLFGLSRYTVMQMKSDPVDALTSLFTTLPATNIINYPFKDIYKAFKKDGSINWRNPASYQLIPIIWKYRYWIYGGGQDKQQEALGKWKKTTTGWWSSRSTRTTRSSNRSTRNSR